MPEIHREGLLPLSDVLRLTSLPQSELYRRMEAATFPLPVQLGPRRVAWRAAEVLDWIAALPGWQGAGKVVGKPRAA